jgi:hypothetical protein
VPRGASLPVQREGLRFAQVDRLKAARFHRSANWRRPGHTVEGRAQLTASLRWSEAVVRRHAAFGDEPKSHVEPPLRRDRR